MSIETTRLCIDVDFVKREGRQSVLRLIIYEDSERNRIQHVWEREWNSGDGPIYSAASFMAFVTGIEDELISEHSGKAYCDDCGLDEEPQEIGAECSYCAVPIEYQLANRDR